MQCDAITKKGCRCSFGHTFTIPNVISGTGRGVNDWIYGRSVHLCTIHGNPFTGKKIPVKLINGGYLQPYNQHNYGSIVLSEIIDWAKFDPIKKYTVPEYWLNQAGQETQSPVGDGGPDGFLNDNG